MPNALIKRVGGKTKIRDWIRSCFPPHKVYAETFGGSFAIGLSMPKASSKYRVVYNDIDKHAWNLFRVLRDHRQELIEKVTATPYSRFEFDVACEVISSKGKRWMDMNPIEWARTFLVFNRQSFAGKEDNTWSIAKTGENNSLTWKGVPSLMARIADHLREAYIECEDYKEILRRWDSPQTLFYMDPPYEGVEANYYHANKEGGFDHVAMAEAAAEVKGSVVVSYYDSPSIRSLYPNFEVHLKEVTKHMQTCDEKDTEVEALFVKKSDWAKRQEKNQDIFG